MGGGRFTLLVLIAVGAVTPAAAGGAPARGVPQPEPARVGNPPAEAARETAFTARVRLFNRSSRRSARATVTFRLAPPSGKQLVAGSVRVGPLARRRSKAVSLRVKVPAAARPGVSYRLIACVQQPRVRARCRSSAQLLDVAAVMVTAGDIASCSSSATGDDATAALLDVDRGDLVAVLGDLVYPSTGYPDASLANFDACYGPNWGRHKDVSRPVVGNHEYDGQPNAEGYFAYFGSQAGPAPQGWYSYDLGSWHVIALNSNCGARDPKVSCTTTSEQAAWLRADLAANPARCTVALWHHPRFSSWSETAPRPEVAPLWQILDEAGADLLLTGHAHAYERFAPQAHNGVADPSGIRQFIVGTGGINKHQFNMESANSEKADNSTYGVLDLTLRATGYDWDFRPVAGGSFADSGSASCL